METFNCLPRAMNIPTSGLTATVNKPVPRYLGRRPLEAASPKEHLRNKAANVAPLGRHRLHAQHESFTRHPPPHRRLQGSSKRLNTSRGTHRSVAAFSGTDLYDICISVACTVVGACAVAFGTSSISNAYIQYDKTLSLVQPDVSTAQARVTEKGSFSSANGKSSIRYYFIDTVFEASRHNGSRYTVYLKNILSGEKEYNRLQVGDTFPVVYRGERPDICSRKSEVSLDDGRLALTFGTGLGALIICTGLILLGIEFFKVPGVARWLFVVLAVLSAGIASYGSFQSWEFFVNDKVDSAVVVSIDATQARSPPKP